MRGRVGKLCCTWLVDTGAVVSCVSAALPGIDSIPRRPAEHNPVGANGLPLQCVGEISADLLIGPAAVSNAKILVVENLSAPAILGTDVLRKFKTFSVDFSKRSLHIGDFSVQLEARLDGTPAQPVAVRLASDYILDPFSERVIDTRAVDFGASVRDVVFDPDISRAERLGVSLCPCLARSDVRNRIPILAKNAGAEPVKLYANSVLGEVSDGKVAEMAGGKKPPREGPVQVDLSDVELGEPDRRALRKLLDSYRDVFANRDEELGRTHLVQFSINTGDSFPVAVRPRRTPYHLRSEVRKQIAEMEDRGIIQKSKSPWSAPILMVKKADGSYRFAVDFRELNRKTADEVTYLPSVKECLDSLAGSRLFTTLDLNSAYWQVPVAPGDRQKTAFTTEDNKWEFLVMPFGAKGAPGCFSRLMSEVLQSLLGNGVTSYLDDVIVGGRSVAEHLSLLQAVLQRLREAGLTVKSSKVVPCQRRIRFLGHVVSADQLEPDPDRVEVIRNWPRPETTKQVRQFTGICNYYSDFVPNLQRLAAPLHEISGKARFSWDARREQAFSRLKDALCSAAGLHLPDMNRRFEVSTDDSGLGCVLSQRSDDGKDRPVCFASKAFSDSERNWHIRDKEVFALIFAVRKFRAYLLGKPFQWFTDHYGLQWLRNTKDPRGRYARWIEELEEFQFTTQFRKGVDNCPADALSRMYGHVEQVAVEQVAEVTHSARKPNGDEEMLAAQEEDKTLRALRHELCLNRTGGRAGSRWRHLGVQPYIDAHSGLLVGRKGSRRYVLVPERMIVRVLQLKHDEAGHFGALRTSVLVREAGYLWMGMDQDIKNYCRSCLVCARSNDPQRRLRAPLEMTTQPTAPWQHVAVDLMGPFGRLPTKRGNRYVLVALDLLSKGVEIAAISDKSAETVARALTEVIYRHGLPESLLTDRGLEFDNRSLVVLAEAMGIDKKRVSAFHPQSNGAVERANKTIGSMLRRNVQEYGGSWDEYISLTRFQYMTVPHHTTGFSPFYLQYGRHPRTPGMARLDGPESPRTVTEQSWAKRIEKDIRKAHEQVVVREEGKKEKRVERSRQSGDSQKYQEGERVFMKVPMRPGMPRKIQSRWAGPFIVISCRQGNTYRIKKEDNFRQRYLRHFDQLKPVERREERLCYRTDEETGQAGHGSSGGPRQDREQGVDRSKRAPVQEELYPTSEDSEDEDEDEEEQDESNNQQEVPRRPEPPAAQWRRQRVSRPPDKYGEWTV